MKQRAIHKRRAFTPPPCKACGPVDVRYSYVRHQYRRRWQVAITCGTCLTEIARAAPCKLPARIKIAINPNGAVFEIKYPPEPSEFEIQAYLYCELRRLGYDARGEVTTKDGDCRFDLVIFCAGRPVRIIECKRSRKQYRSRQIEQYGLYQVKVVSVCGKEQAKQLIAKAAAAGPKKALQFLV